MQSEIFPVSSESLVLQPRIDNLYLADMKRHSLRNVSTEQREGGPIWPVLLFTVLYILAAVVGAFINGNHEFLVYIGVMLLLIGLVWVVHRTVTLSSATLWTLSFWGCAHMAGGLLAVPSHWPVETESPVLYNLWLIPGWLKYDQLVHAYGFGITTWVCWQGLRRALLYNTGQNKPTPGLLILIAAAGMGFGALNEVIEFCATLLLPETNVGGYLNTSLDLVANLIGVTLAVTLIWYFEGRTEKDG